MKGNLWGFGDARALGAYIIVCIVWGSTYLAIRVGVSDLPPALFAGIRFLAAGSILLLYAWARKLKPPETWQDIKVSSVVGLFLLFGGNGLVVWGEQWVHSGLAALLIATVPLFMALLDTIIPGGRGISRMGWAGLLLGFAGVALLIGPGIKTGGNALLGMVGVVFASFLWASGSVYSSRHVVKGSIVYNIAAQSLAGGVALTLTGVFTGQLSNFHPTPQGMGAMLYLIIFGSLAGYSAYIYMLKVLPPAKASTYAYINPVVAVLLGAMVLSEPVTARTVLSAGIILGGVLLVQMSKVSVSPAKGALNKGAKSESTA